MVNLGKYLNLSVEAKERNDTTSTSHPSLPKKKKKKTTSTFKTHLIHFLIKVTGSNPSFQPEPQSFHFWIMRPRLSSLSFKPYLLPSYATMSTSSTSQALPLTLNKYSRTITQPKDQGASQVCFPHLKLFWLFNHSFIHSFIRQCSMQPRGSNLRMIYKNLW